MMRKSVHDFALAMDKKLDEREARNGPRGWDECDREYLLERMLDEFIELREAVRYWNVSSRNICDECCDVANFAMMLFDNHDRVKTSEGTVTFHSNIGPKR